MAGEKTYGTPIKEVKIDGVYHKVEGSDSGGLTEISSQYIRITDLDTGVYKLTYNGTKYIYYNGESDTTNYVEISRSYKILTVTKYTTYDDTPYWHWSFSPQPGVVCPFMMGSTTSSEGTYNKNGAVVEDKHSEIHIRSLPAGQYRLTYDGAKTIYYNSNSYLPTTYGALNGVLHLTVSTYTSSTTTYKIWHMQTGASGQYMLSGSTTESGSGSYRAFNLSGSYLTTHLYRSIQVNGTQILANTASTALNLANDGNVKFAQVSGGKVKASITGLEVAKLFDFTVYNDTYTWGHLTSSNGYTQLFSLDTAAGASIGLAEKDGKLSMQIDGDYYGNEGANRLVYDYETPRTCLNSNGTTPEVSLDNSYFNTNPYIGTVNPSGTEWHYVINVPHRGGNGGDGYLYDFQLATRLDINDPLRWRTKNNGTWSSWSEIPRVIPTTALTHIATIDSSTYYMNPNSLSYGTTYVVFSVFNSAQLQLGVYDDDSGGDYTWYGIYGGITFITFRQDWTIFVYNEKNGSYTPLSMTDDFAIKSNYGPIEICQLKV